MATLPDTKAFQRAVTAEVRKQTAKSVRSKLAIVAVMIAAIAVIVGLDAMKTQLQNVRERPYEATRVADYLKSNSTLRKPAATLASRRRKTREPLRFATADDLYAALLGETNIAGGLLSKQQNIREDWAQLIEKKDGEIRAAVAAEQSPADPTKDPQDEKKRLAEAKKKLDDLKAARAELISARAAELVEADQKSIADKAAFRRAFDDSQVEKNVLSEFHVTGNAAVDVFLEHVADPNHPLSIIYDVLWYASLVIGVLAFITLLLQPLFRAIPVAGANDKFMDQVKGVFGRAPRVVGTGARLAALTIGTAAIVSVATTAPSSPLYESGLVPAAQDAQQKAPPDSANGKQRGEEPKPPQPPKPPYGGGGGQKPPNPATDPRVDTLLADVEQLKNDTAADRQVLDLQKQTLDSHKETLGAHEQTLVAQDRTLRSQEASLQTLHELPTQVATLATNEGNQVRDLGTRFSGVDTRIHDVSEIASSADIKAEFAQKEAEAVGKQVEAASKQINARAKEIDEGVSLPYQVGERPATLRSLFGFDRYRITNASVKYVERAGASADVVAAVKSLVSDDVLSNDEVRASFRLQICRSNANCKPYLAWRGVVLRSARM